MSDTPISLAEFKQRVAVLEVAAPPLVHSSGSLAALEEVRADLVGRTRGRVKEIEALVPVLAAGDRPTAGRLVQGLRALIEGAIQIRSAELAPAETANAPRPDLSMPARTVWRGGPHPVTVVIDEITAIFRELGFTVALGPEAETNWYNFGALNFPADHPAMDLHDTLYLSDDVVLRTHTSPVQVRTLQQSPPPIRIIAPGNCYRRDFFDASHAPMFAQIEGLAVDEGVSFVDLKATLTHFASRFFGTTVTRFRPSYFPFTEPSAEMDVQCQICHGAGCATCKQTGWVEILGSGMVHPAVLEAAGVDAERYSGWAFGMGPARIATQRYGIPDIRELYDTDVRVLESLTR
ncbi:MAG TPA: phenylalanine--tRNA ligase subunit alpha [Gemmatimonadaceae bacterium]|nr:phenylalanine--tRNA ligase subunit alpha [Gemmatimonadaceae bacterium]